MKQFGWSRMALITQSENIFTFVSVRIVSYCYVHRLYVNRVARNLSVLMSLIYSNKTVNLKCIIMSIYYNTTVEVFSLLIYTVLHDVSQFLHYIIY